MAGQESDRRPTWLLALLLAIGLVVAPAQAADDRVGVELNKAEDQSGGCRLYFVLDNATNAAFEVYKLDLVMFGADGVIARRLAVEVGPLRPAKTSVKLFDVAGLPCAGIGTALINDVLSCKVGADERPNCIDLISVASRARIALTK